MIVNENGFIELNGFSGSRESMDLNEFIEYKKSFGKVLNESQKNAKRKTCYYCKKECKGFCNSHTTPAFCLEYLAVKGMLYNLNTLVELPVLKSEFGVNEAGTFHIICRECDSQLFQEYENEKNYDKETTTKMLALIELKNYLKLIDKNILEKSLLLNLIKKHEIPEFMVENKLRVNQLNKVDLESHYNYAKRSSLKPFEGDYHIGLKLMLPYRIPIAFQGAITMICDLNGIIINNVYDLSDKYKVKNVNVCLFPLKEKSVIMLFVEHNNNRYKSFFKQLNALPLNEKLKVINYIVFAFSEDFFISPKLSVETINSLKKVASKSTEVITEISSNDSLAKAKEYFTFEEMNTIPNILSEEYALKDE